MSGRRAAGPEAWAWGTDLSTWRFGTVGSAYGRVSGSPDLGQLRLGPRLADGTGHGPRHGPGPRLLAGARPGPGGLDRDGAGAAPAASRRASAWTANGRWSRLRARRPGAGGSGIRRIDVTAVTAGSPERSGAGWAGRRLRAGSPSSERWSWRRETAAMTGPSGQLSGSDSGRQARRLRAGAGRKGSVGVLRDERPDSRTPMQHARSRGRGRDRCLDAGSAGRAQVGRLLRTPASMGTTATRQTCGAGIEMAPRSRHAPWSAERGQALAANQSSRGGEEQKRSRPQQPLPQHGRRPREGTACARR